ncbi:hypothetical protein L6164_005797 [Bauhinia variegata]|uniref:Uncharacterized protein n=1 Tax=Bauhinia variegata TaxID=167791 RepID=A0ACB9PSD2_BAUVA|nr:hypothetical protein L6164_005797 [Bauhinia variegata]
MEEQLQGLSWVEKEDDGLVFDVDHNLETNANLELCLVGLFLTDKVLRIPIMKERMANVWRPGRGVTIREINPGVLLFQFYHKLDITRVFNGGPWSFDNHMLILEPINPGDIVSEIPLFHVRVDVRLPLKKVKKPGGEWRVVKVKYERLGVFCFLCGVLGHTEHFCEKLFSMKSDDGARGGDWRSGWRLGKKVEVAQGGAGDKLGRVEHPQWLIHGFRDAITDCNLIDIPLEGYPYTWSRSRGTDNAVEEKLDGALALSLWLDLFQNASLHNLVAPISDHNPIVLKLFRHKRVVFKRRFRFKNAWLTEEGLEDVVHGGWNLAHNEDLSTKLKNCAKHMDRWGRDLRTKFRHEVDSLKKEMERLRVLDDLDSVTLFNSRKDHLAALLVQEDQYLR